MNYAGICMDETGVESVTLMLYPVNELYPNLGMQKYKKGYPFGVMVRVLTVWAF